MDELFQMGFWIAAMVATLGVVVLLLVREQPSTTRRAFLGFFLTLAVEAGCVLASFTTSDPRWIVLTVRLRLITMALLPGWLLLVGLRYGRADNTESLARHRVLVRGAFFIPIAVALLNHRSLAGFATTTEEYRFELIRFGGSGIAVLILFLAASIYALTQLERTLRESVGTMRWRIKYIVLGLGVLLVTRLYTTSQCLLYAAPSTTLEGLNAFGLLLGSLLVMFALFRGHLGSVDVYLSQRALYYSFTVLISGVYLLSVGILARLTAHLGGEDTLPLRSFFILVALLGFTILLLSARFRRRANRIISQHFNRPEHDYRRVWRSFAQQTASVTELSEYCRAVTSLIAETLEVLSVTLWIVPPGRGSLEFGSSTSLSETDANTILESTDENQDLFHALHALKGPQSLDTAEQNGLGILRRSNPATFDARSHYCLPLRAGNHLVGALVVGDRVSYLPYSLEDLDLLETLSLQIAANLWTLQLSDELVEAKELAAFQTMSTFFVHDLKNTASTLSLMVENLPRHFDDPAFREDALKGMQKSVGRVNDLVQRLTLLRESLVLSPQPTDLNQVVSDTLQSLDGTLGLETHCDLSPLPPIPLDPSQFRNVLENLFINARDASPGEGRIEIATSSQGDEAVLTVRDHGCGMSPEFVRESLFKPFRTTKKKGMGIGLFHSRMIVEAHHGRIQVQSKPDQGTTFRILLPLSTELNPTETQPTS